MRISFSECDPGATDEEIGAAEAACRLRFPMGLRRLFRESNGGRPDPSVFRRDGKEIAVSECLALRSGRGSALWTYETIVVDKALVPPSFFPFAVDPGGSYFFVDCSSANGAVLFYVHDTASSDNLVPLGVGFEDFWDCLA